ncbi:hypothetical protein [Patulibacter americanus]|uniref:hypothetical protein n=1 Tax=Patulibacter americanus TaxID=588672 RepID=UPI0003B36B33|nr:hypothetical protein [Patulibacter americanus]
MRRILLIVLGGALLVPAGASGAVRHAAPGGTGSACEATTPCRLFTALDGAAAGDEVVVAPGDYGSAAAPLTFDGQFNAPGLDVHGLPGQPRPRIYSSAAYALAFYGGGVRVSHLHVITTGDGQTPLSLSFAPGSVADDVVAEARGSSTACFVGNVQTIQNSVCWASGENGRGVAALGSVYGPTDATLRNVTAWSAQGEAVFAQSSADRPVQLHLRNVIAQGSGVSIGAYAFDAPATIDASGSNFPPEEVEASVGATAPSAAGNQSTPPLLNDPEAGDFSQVAGSPTVDAGRDDQTAGTFAFGGLTPRVLGGGVDIGADEQTVAPAVGTANLGPVGPTTAVLVGTVDPEGLATTHRFEYGPTTAYGSATPEGTLPVGGAPVTVSGALDGLAPRTTYHARLVATNARGTTVGPDVTFTTTSIDVLAPPRVGSPGPPLPPPVPVAPKLAAVSVTPARARAGKAVRLKLRLDQDATVRIGLVRLSTGRRKGTRCVAPAKAARKAKRCTRAVPVRSIRRELDAGTRTVTLPRTFLPRAAGRYRITVQATAADGRRSRTTTRALTVLR